MSIETSSSVSSTAPPDELPQWRILPRSWWRALGALTFFLCLSIPALILYVILNGSIDDLVRFAPDDAFYYLNIARHLAASGQPSFDGITVTTGFHPLYAVLLVILFKVFNPSPEGFVRLAALLNFALYAFAFAASYRIGKILHRRIGGLVMAVVFLSSARIALYVLSGMEASLTVCTVAFFMLAFLRVYRSDLLAPAPLTFSAAFLLGVTGGLVVLARAENSLFVYGALGIILLRYAASSGSLSWSVVRGCAAAFMLVAFCQGGWMTYCYQTTGSWVQSSAIMKQIFRSMETETLTPFARSLYSIDLFLEFVGRAALAVPMVKYLAPLALWYLIVKACPTLQFKLIVGFLIVSIVTYGAIFALLLPGIHLWYLALAATVLCIVAVVVAIEGLSTQLPRWVRIVGLVAFMLASIEGVVTTAVALHRSVRSSRADTMKFATEVLSNLPANSIIASWNAGLFGYFSERPVINLDGLVNKEIIEAHRSGALNWPYWRARHLTHLVDDSRWFAGIPRCFEGYCLERIAERALSRGRTIELYEIRSGGER